MFIIEVNGDHKSLLTVTATDASLDDSKLLCERISKINNLTGALEVPPVEEQCIHRQYKKEDNCVLVD